MDNVKMLPGGSTEVNSEKLLEELKAKMPFMLEYAAITAEITRKRYLVLVANGFTETQALELCWRPLS